MLKDLLRTSDLTNDDLVRLLGDGRLHAAAALLLARHRGYLKGAAPEPVAVVT